MAAAGGPAGKGRDISLAALRRHDPYISRIVDVASQVALYTFGHRANEWEKTDVEGTLFVYTRSASPKHGFTIMNRLSMENRTEPITKDLDFLLQDPFLLYRNARLSIYGIWFYDKEECQRIAELMKNLTQYEQLKAHHGAGAGASPVSLGSGEGKEADILRMLTKAKDEYTKCKTCSEPKQISSSSAIHDNPNLIKPIPVKPSGSRQQRGPRPSQTSDPEPQHLSLTALFGKQDKAPCQEATGPPQTLPLQQQQQPETLPTRQGVVRSLSYEEPRRPSPPVDKQLCPAIQKLMIRSVDLQPLAELPENRPCTDALRAACAGPARTGSPCSRALAAPGTQNPLPLQSIPGAENRCEPGAPAPASSTTTHAAPAQPTCLSSALPPQTPGPRALPRPAPPGPSPGHQPVGPGEVSPRELLRRLQAVQQDQQLPVPGRPALAAKFPAATPSTRARNPLEPWRDPPPSTEQPAPLLQVLSPQRIPAAATPSPLMSPLVFAQPSWAPPQERSRAPLPPGNQDPAATPAGLLLPLRTPEPPGTSGSALSKPQLQEALLHLIQNDDNFLNIIYEAYLFSLTQAAVKKTL